MNTSRSGFTLIELLVSIAIIGILAAVMYANFGGTNALGRDAKRASDLRSLQVAIEQYKQKNGRYPTMGCGTPSNDAGNNTPVFATESSCSDYVQGVAPEFMSKLPHDPARGSEPGFAYLTNTSGTVYKVTVARTVEEKIVTTADGDLHACAIGTDEWCNAGLGALTYTGWCSTTNANYNSSYAQWGGFVLNGDYTKDEYTSWSTTLKRNRSLPTLNVICRQP